MLLIIDGYNLIFGGLLSSKGGTKHIPDTSSSSRTGLHLHPVRSEHSRVKGDSTNSNSLALDASNGASGFLERARDKLVSKLKFYNTRGKHQIIVVFDGANNTGYYHSQKELSGIKIIFSSGKSTADDLIINLVSSYDKIKRQSLRIVTSDRQLTGILLKYGVKVTPVSEFINELPSNKRGNKSDLLEEPIEKFIGLQPSEVNKWLKVFSK